MQDTLQALRNRLDNASERFYGYPCNLDFNYDEIIPFLKYGLNNIGEPFSKSNHAIHTRDLEGEVIRIYASLVNMPANDVWGYVTNGGTEGNLYGLYVARELHPEGIVYYSETTHYSVQKIIRLLNVKSVMLRSLDNGEIDYTDLDEMLKTHQDSPAIIFANFGTTMTGAIDNIHTIKNLIQKNNIDQHYIHADGALSGMILPFLDQQLGYDFTYGIDSMSVSGHKFIGAPIPCGIVLAKKQNVAKLSTQIEYIGAVDNTITGSRNGFTPLILWYAFKKFGITGFTQLVQQCIQVTEYAVNEFNKNGIPAWCNPHSITVVIPRPSTSLIEHYQLAPEKNIAHIICMPHITPDKIDIIVKDIVKDAEILRSGT